MISSWLSSGRAAFGVSETNKSPAQASYFCRCGDARGPDSHSSPAPNDLAAPPRRSAEKHGTRARATPAKSDTAWPPTAFLGIVSPGGPLCITGFVRIQPLAVAVRADPPTGHMSPHLLVRTAGTGGRRGSAASCTTFVWSDGSSISWITSDPVSMSAFTTLNPLSALTTGCGASDGARLAGRAVRIPPQKREAGPPDSQGSRLRLLA